MGDKKIVLNREVKPYMEAQAAARVFKQKRKQRGIYFTLTNVARKGTKGRKGFRGS